MSPRRSLLVAVVAVFAVVLLFTVGPAGGADEGGPLQGPGCCYGASWIAADGETMTFSHIELVNSGSEPVQIESVELIDADPSLQVAGVLAGEHEGDSLLAGSEVFPPETNEYADYGVQAVHPAVGYIVRPQPGGAYGDSAASTQLFIGLKPPRSGRARFNSVRVHYRAGLRRFVLRIGYAGMLCAPPRGVDRAEQDCVADASN
jgi:hypothetical protein